MDSSENRISAPKRSHPANFPATRYISTGRRTPYSSSFSSLSSCSPNSIAFLDDSPLNSPATPLRFLGVPFSWEKLPGIPKNLHNNIINHHRRNESVNLLQDLPLPPHLNHHLPTTRKNPNQRMNNSFFSRDPFVAALVECSKDNGDDDDDDEDDGVDRNPRRFFGNNGGSSKALSKTVSDRFGFVNLYGSCRRTCAVSESIVYLPRPTRASYDHLLHRRGSRR